MPKLITASTFLLFWVFFEMSGGTDFKPRERIVVSNAPFAKLDTTAPAPVQPAQTAVVTNASFVPVETVVMPAVAQQTTAAVITEPEVVAAPAVAEVPQIRLAYVAGNRVNMRRGPGTNHPVVGTVSRGTEVELIASNDVGWARIRLTETDQLGWMAQSLLSDG